MNKYKIQVGDLVTDNVSGRDDLGLVAKILDDQRVDAVVEVYWFKLGQVQLAWLSYLLKLENPNE